MKKNNRYLLLLAVLFAMQARAQNVGINEDKSLPNANALLDVKSFNKGVLVPRVSTAARLAIPHTKGLLVYDTTAASFFYSTGTVWRNMLATGSAWLTGGNSGTDSTNFLGTTDNKPFRFMINNKLSGRVDAGSSNAFLGYNTDAAPGDSARFNTSIGNNSLTANTSGSNNTVHGSFSLFNNNSGNNNTAIGSNTLAHNIKGSFNTGIGAGTLLTNTFGSFNTAEGAYALAFNETGSYNTALGEASMYGNTTGSYNTVTGSNSMTFATAGDYNTVSGVQSLDSNTTGRDNTTLGSRSMNFNKTGSYNTAVGFSALIHNSSGNFNTDIGGSMENNTTGSSNTAVGGDNGLLFNTTGDYNTAIGGALSNNITGSNNTGIGGGANVSTGNLTNATAIGSGTTVNASNKVRFGDNSITVIEGQVPFTTPSDGRFKYQVREDVKGLDFIMHLRPVTYLFDTRRFDQMQKSTIAYKAPKAGGHEAAMRIRDNALRNSDAAIPAVRESGFIAQEVEKAATAAGYNFSGIIKPATKEGHYGLSYAAFVVPLVKSIQEQQRVIAMQKQQLDALEKHINTNSKAYKEIAALQEEITALSQLLHAVPSNK